MQTNLMQEVTHVTGSSQPLKGGVSLNQPGENIAHRIMDRLHSVHTSLAVCVYVCVCVCVCVSVSVSVSVRVYVTVCECILAHMHM